MINWDDITHVNATHIDAVKAVVKPTDSLISTAKARDLLSAPSGSRPRMYGLTIVDDRYQMVALRSIYHLDEYKPVAQWLSGTTLEDLIQPA